MSIWDDEYQFLASQNSEGVKKLVDGGRTFNARSTNGETHLHMAVGNGDAEFVDAWLHAKINPNARDLYGRTPLHEAALVGVGDVVSKLIAGGADPNAKNEDGQTPLHVAASTSELDTEVIVAELLDAGAIAKARDKDGKTPWDLAQGNGMLEGRDAYWRLNDGRFEVAADDGLEIEARMMAGLLANPEMVPMSKQPDERFPVLAELAIAAAEALRQAAFKAE